MSSQSVDFMLRDSQTWQDAHDEYCRRNKCLQASISQILSEGVDTIEGADISWSIPRVDEVVTSSQHEKIHLDDTSHHDATPQESQPSAPFKALTYMKSLAGGIYSKVVDYSRKDEFWQEPDNDFNNPLNSLECHEFVDIREPIVHLSLTRHYLSAITRALSQKPSINLPMVHYCPPWTIMNQSDWKEWLHEVVHEYKEQMLPSISDKDSIWLLDVLIAWNRIRNFSRDDQKPNLIVYKSSWSTDERKMKLRDIQSLQIPLSLFDLSYSIRRLEHQINEWKKQIPMFSKKALELKKEGQSKPALTQLLRRNIVQQRIDSHSAAIVQLEHVYSSIEMAQSNQSMVDLLSESTAVLKSLTDQVKAEDINSLQNSMEDLLTEVDQTHAALTSTTINETDEDLLQELATLSLGTTSVDDTPMQSLDLVPTDAKLDDNKLSEYSCSREKQDKDEKQTLSPAAV